MFVNEFESSSAYRLQQIVSTLKNVHGVELDLGSHSDNEVRALAESSEIIKNSIVKESAFNSWMQNPEYTKNMLILEAARLYLTEIAPKRQLKKSKAVKESTLEEGPRGMSVASRDWALNKTSRSDMKPALAPYRPSWEKSKKDMRDELASDSDLMKDFIARGGKTTKIKEAGPEDLARSAELGRAMMDYAQTAEHRGDEKELKILNAISQVGDKLTQLGTPFGPRMLTDLDKKVIYFAKKRMGWNAAIEEDPQQPQKPGTVTMSKDGITTTVPPEKVSVELPKLSAQGFKPTEVNETADELDQLMKQYGVLDEADMDEGNEFSGALAAAKAAGKDTFTVGGKTYDVKEASAMMEAAKGPDLDALKEKKAKLEDKMDTIVKDGGKVLKTDPLRKQYDKVVADIKAAKKTVNEGMHMEAHDDYQASMARSELYRNTKYAMDMMKMVGPEDEVKPWVAANLTKAAQALDKIYHYMDYYLTFEPEKTQNVDEDSNAMIDEGSVGSVARRNLMMIMEYSTKLFRMIQPGDKLEGWVAMKLTNASEAISSSKHYMDYAQFDKHVGHEMDGIVDEPVDLPPMPVQEYKSKKNKKKTVKEGRLVTVGNILMAAMIKEDQDLAQAQTLLAAKAMSDDLQNMAEKIAKMSVEDLMPIVDTMKEQFGQELANGFNDTMKTALEAVLNAATEAKETADNSILSLQSGQVPGAGTTDIESTDDIDMDTDSSEEDEFAGTPAAAGPAEEPLGRAEKPEGDEEAPEELEEAKAATPKITARKHEGNDAASWAVFIDGKPFVTGLTQREVAHYKKKAADMVASQSKIEEAKKAKAPGAVATAQVMKMGGRFVAKDGKTLTKAGITKRDEIAKTIEKEQADKKKIDEAKKAKPDFLDIDKDGDKKEPMKKAAKEKKAKGKVEESAPPGKKAEDFIKSNKAGFKDRYGDRWEEVLYATAWKKFGKKEESAVKTAKMLEAAKANKAQLVKAFDTHKTQFKKMVSEGIARDPLKAGYGLEGETLLDQLGDVDSMISKLKEMLKSEMQQGVSKMLADAKQAEKAEVLESKKQTAPFGVIWKASNAKKSKFFETADLRSYWIDLNKINLVEAKLINPEDFDEKITKLNKKG
jgi:hypothetical protein